MSASPAAAGGASTDVRQFFQWLSYLQYTALEMRESHRLDKQSPRPLDTALEAGA